MRVQKTGGGRRDQESGMSLVLVAAGLVVILGVSALAIDLVSLYVARSEAQRAADAGALAGAETFVTSGFTSGAGSPSAVQALARQQAIDVADKNVVGGQFPALGTGDVSFNFSNANNPRITVTVQRTAAAGNPMPTFFAKIFGTKTADVSASATAEAYNPGGLPFFTKCMKPWVLPNCDPNHTDPSNTACSGYASFITPGSGTLPNRGLWMGSSGGIIGSTLNLMPGDPTQPTGPNLYYPADPSAINQQLIDCPACGSTSFTYENNLKCCNLNQWTCGNQNLPPYLPVKLQPSKTDYSLVTRDAIQCLIRQPGQDTLKFDPSSATPFTVLGGSSNPNPALQGKTFMFPPSTSIVNIPLAAPGVYCPGGTCPDTVNLVGFMQIFINSVDANGTVHAVVLNVTTCPNGPNPGQGGGSGYTIIPVRLVQPG